MNVSSLLKNAQIVAVVCNQWGDSGKGKIVDSLAPWADVIARGTGANNAGHTVVIDGMQHILHLIPCGIFYDKEGKINILGNGMAIDPLALCQELDYLTGAGLSYNNLVISQDAHVIMPYHIAKDRLKYQSQAKGGIGSTGKGTGPAYEDKIGRRGIMIRDLLDTDILAAKIEAIKPFYPDQPIDTEEIIQQLKPAIEKIKDMMRDTISEMHQFVRQGKKILLEGAQGLHLSIEYGTYPYVTSSDPSLNGTAAGAGIPARIVDRCFGLVKFPFMTRVGGGPFPTELGAAEYLKNCAKNSDYTLAYELEQYKVPFTTTNQRVKYDHHHSRIIELMNATDFFEKSVGIRLAAGEFGATSGRPRRPGWTDALATKNAVGINGPELILTKPDCLAGIDEFSICYGYNDNGNQLTDFNKDCSFLERVQPVYKNYKGYTDISSVRRYDELPVSLSEAIADFEKFTGGQVAAISVGPEADQTIIR